MNIEKAIAVMKNRKSTIEFEQAVEIAIKVLPYSVDMPVRDKKCPRCQKELTDPEWGYCPYCGQAICWVNK